MLFLSGHGVDDRNGYYYFLPHNADRERLKRTGVNFSDIQNTLYALSGKVVLFIDTCRAGGVTQRPWAPAAATCRWMSTGWPMTLPVRRTG